MGTEIVGGAFVYALREWKKKGEACVFFKRAKKENRIPEGRRIFLQRKRKEGIQKGSSSATQGPRQLQRENIRGT